MPDKRKGVTIERSISPMLTPDKYEPETDRLQFIIARDGIDEAIIFAYRTMVAYRRAVLSKQIMYDSDKRRTFIESYLAFKRFIDDHCEIPILRESYNIDY